MSGFCFFLQQIHQECSFVCFLWLWDCVKLLKVPGFEFSCCRADLIFDHLELVCSLLLLSEVVKNQQQNKRTAEGQLVEACRVWGHTKMFYCNFEGSVIVKVFVFILQFKGVHQGALFFCYFACLVMFRF